MGADTDFVKLYRELGLDADCTLDAFRQAYRKRVAALHPDRPGAAMQMPDKLQALNATYAAAMEFHRRHGRLPGASPSPTPAANARPVETPVPPPGRSAAQAAPARSGPHWMLLAVAVLVAGIWLYSLSESGADSESARIAKADVVLSTDTPGTQVPTPTAMTLGSTAQQVRELNGEPVSGWEQRWEYGPSWVAFRCGVVVDWYSSPLRPLRVDTQNPPATTEWSPPRHCKE